MIEKICHNCDRPFNVYPSHIKRKYCSKECSAAYQGRHKENYVCECCGKLFRWSPSRVKSRDIKYCSRKCYGIVMRGERGTNWKGGKYKNKTSGMIKQLVSSRDNGSRETYISEHRLIAAKIIGRPLIPSEKIIHINRVNDDNRPENIYICASNVEMMKRFKSMLPWPEYSNLDIYR